MSEHFDESGLLEAVTRAGELSPSADQLKRWRRAGLIPRPEVEHPPGLKGSRARYPAWTVGQVVAVVRLHRSHHRLRDLVVAVWWEGHWVRPDALRKALIAPLGRISDETKEARGEETDPYEAADAIVSIVRNEPRSSQSSALLRSRLNGSSDLMDLLWTFLVLGLGGDAPWEEEDRSTQDSAPDALTLVTAATGAERAMKDDPLGMGPLVPADFDMPGFLTELREAGGFEFGDMAREIREASDEDLVQARSDALLFCGPLAMICSVLEDLLGDDVAGLGSLRAFESSTSTDRASLIRVMLILRRLAGDDAFARVGEVVRGVEPRYAAIQEFRAGLPQYGHLLRLDYSDRLAALPAPEADRVRDDVDAYLRDHVQVALALDCAD